MEAAELIKKVRKIEIYTRGLSRQMFTGGYQSAFKGRGMAFAEVRDYTPGDEIRTIDWNVTARMNHPYVKVFEEERELTVILMIDVSGSLDFGSRGQMKKGQMTEIAAVLAFSAINNNDKIGVIFFSDRVEKFIPPKKGKSHILRIIRELIEFKPVASETDVGEALRYLTNVMKKRSIVFIMSDFLCDDFEKPLRVASRKHDTIMMQYYDELEERLPSLGMINIQDPESGKSKMIDSSSSRVRRQYQQWWQTHQSRLVSVFSRNNVDVIKFKPDESYIAPLKNFFRQRLKRR